MTSGSKQASAAWGNRSHPPAKRACSGRSLALYFIASWAFLMHRLLTCRLRADVPSVVSLYAHVQLGQRSAPPIPPRFRTELCPKRSAISACAFCLRCRESAGGGFGPRFRGSAGRSSGCLPAANCLRKPVSGFRSRWGWSAVSNRFPRLRWL